MELKVNCRRCGALIRLTMELSIAEQAFLSIAQDLLCARCAYHRPSVKKATHGRLGGPRPAARGVYLDD